MLRYAPDLSVEGGLGGDQGSLPGISRNCQSWPAQSRSTCRHCKPQVATSGPHQSMSSATGSPSDQPNPRERERCLQTHFDGEAFNVVASGLLSMDCLAGPSEAGAVSSP